jgi:hypothetical protein
MGVSCSFHALVCGVSTSLNVLVQGLGVRCRLLLFALLGSMAIEGMYQVAKIAYTSKLCLVADIVMCLSGVCKHALMLWGLFLGQVPSSF